MMLNPRKTLTFMLAASLASTIGGLPFNTLPILLGALADLHAAAAAVLVQGPPAAASPALLQAQMGALLVHNLSKCVTAGLSGGRVYLLALAPGLLAQVAVVLGLLVWRGAV